MVTGVQRCALPIYYREGAYVDLYLYQMDRDTWNERWPNEREYAPLGDETER